MSHYALIKDKKLVSLEEGPEGKKKATDAFFNEEVDAVQELKSRSDVGELVDRLNQEEDDWGKIKNWFRGVIHTSTDAINKEADRLMEEAEAHSSDLKTRVQACIKLAKDAGADKLEELRRTREEFKGKKDDAAETETPET